MKTLWSDTAALARLTDAPALAAFFDFDGTLVPFAAAPDHINVPEGVVPLLTQLSAQAGRTVGIISGRSVADIARYVTLPKSVMVAGNHGLEWVIGGDYHTAKLPDGYLPALKRLYGSLQALSGTFPGLSAEWKDLTISMHLRLVDEARRKEAADAIDLHIRESADAQVFRVLRGTWDSDVRPAMTWTKAEAVAHLLQNAAVDSGTLLYVGDDVTDEDVFVAYPHAVTVHVGAAKSHAGYRLDSPGEVLRLLTFLVTGQLVR